jgi:hypothetical protein
MAVWVYGISLIVAIDSPYRYPIMPLVTSRKLGSHAFESPRQSAKAV